MMKRLFEFLAILACGFSSLSWAADGAPKTIEYQGTVFDATGAPLAPTIPRLYKMEFRLWDQLEGGTLLWSEQQYVNVSNGQFSLRIGEGQAATDATPPVFAQSDLAAAFAGKNRFLGLTVVNPPAANAEISPRLAMLSAPYAIVANQATKVVQRPGTFSSVTAGMVAYSVQAVSSQASVTLALDKRINTISAGASGTIANLPANGDHKELVVIKTDDTAQFVTVTAPAGGKINTTKTKIFLKVKGDSITLQNIGGDDWWIVKDSRDSTQVGTIIAYATDTPPKGYLRCDGSSYSRTAYADLFEAIGTTWGASLANSTDAPATAPISGALSATLFNVPQLNGRFLRGINPGAGGADEDAGARFALFTGGSSVVGSYQQDSIRKHAHGITDPGHSHTASISGSTASGIPIGWSVGPKGADDMMTAFSPSSGGTTHTMSANVTIAAGNTGITGTNSVTDGGSGLRLGTETRPDSAVVRYCIKY